MSFLETSHVANGPFGSPDPLADLQHYFELNGYTVVEKTLGPRPEALTWKRVPSESDDKADVTITPDDPREVSDQDPAETNSEEPTPGPPPPEVSDEIIVALTMRRGEKGNSLWTSNMAELLCDLSIKLIGDSVRIAYKIETTLQHFNDDDNAFWAHEAKQATRVVLGQGKAIDWRENEEIRVGRQQKDILMVGVQLAVLAAILVAIGYFAFTGG